MVKKENDQEPDCVPHRQIDESTEKAELKSAKLLSKKEDADKKARANEERGRFKKLLGSLNLDMVEI